MMVLLLIWLWFEYGDTALIEVGPLRMQEQSDVLQRALACIQMKDLLK